MDFVTASPETPLHEVAALLEKNAIKRVPIVENGQLVGLVSRANLIQAVASAGFGPLPGMITNGRVQPIAAISQKENSLPGLHKKGWGGT